MNLFTGPYTPFSAAYLVAMLILPRCLTAQTVRVDSLPQGLLAGTVLDATTGGALGHTRVYLSPVPSGMPALGASRGVFWATGLSTETNLQGRYEFDGLGPGRYRLEIRRLGYRPATVELEVFGGTPLQVSVGLLVLPILLEPNTIVARSAPFDRVIPQERQAEARLGVELARRDRYLAGDSRVLTRADVAEAVTLGEPDLFRAFQRMPGVSTRDDFTAELWTRGAAWSHTRVYFDGLPLFNPLHTGGVFSAVSPDAVGGVFFYPGGRSAALGEGAAGVMELVSRRGTPGLHGSAELSVVSGRVAVDGGDADKSFMIAGRRSYVDMLTNWFVDSSNAVPYNLMDVSGRFDVVLGNVVIEGSGLIERDEIRGRVRDLIQGSSGRWGNELGRVTASGALGSLNTSHTVGISRFRGNLEVRGLSGQAADSLVPIHSPMQNTLSFATVKGMIERRGETGWAAGYELTRQQQDYVGPRPRPYPVAFAEDTLDLRESLNSGAVWIEGRWRTGRLAVVPGMRVDMGGRFPALDAPRVGPRVSARVALTADVSLSGSWGRSFQYTQTIAPAGPGVGPNLHLTDVWLLASDTVPVIQSDIVTATVETWLGASWLASGSVYHREASGIAIPDPTPGTVVQDRPLFVPATNEAYGIDVSVRRLAGTWTGSLSYSLSTSNLRSGGLRFPAPSDRRHVIDLTAMSQVAERFRVGGALTAASGAPFTRFYLDVVRCSQVLSCSDADTLFVTRAIGEPNDQRTRAYVGVDLLAEWWYDWGRTRVTAFVQLRNVLQRRNAITYDGSISECVSPGRDGVMNADGSCDRFDRGFPILPFVGVSVTF